jgi:uncharacterized protein (TIGR02271 family)
VTDNRTTTIGGGAHVAPPRSHASATTSHAYDSGEIEYLPDGSVSIPIIEEELVVYKRLVVRERVIVRKEQDIRHERIEAELRRERLEYKEEGEARLE